MKEALCNALEGANKRNREYREQIERLQEQLNEANEVIKGYSKLESLMNLALGKREKGPAQKYLKKYNIS